MPFSFQPAMPALWTAMASWATGRGEGMKQVAELLQRDKEQRRSMGAQQGAQAMDLAANWLFQQQAQQNRLALGGQENAATLARMSYADTIDRYGMTPTELAGEAQAAGMSVPQWKGLLQTERMGMLAEPADWSGIMGRAGITPPVPSQPGQPAVPRDIAGVPAIMPQVGGPPTIEVPPIEAQLGDPTYTMPQKWQIAGLVGALNAIDTNPDFQEGWEKEDAKRAVREQIARIKPVRLPKPDITPPQELTAQRVDFQSRPGSAVIHNADGTTKVTNVGSNPLAGFDLATPEGMQQYLKVAIQPDPYDPDAPVRWTVDSKGSPKLQRIDQEDGAYDRAASRVQRRQALNPARADLPPDPREVGLEMVLEDLAKDQAEQFRTALRDQRKQQEVLRQLQQGIPPQAILSGMAGAGGPEAAAVQGPPLSDAEFYQRRAAAEMGGEPRPLSPAAQAFLQRVQQFAVPLGQESAGPPVAASPQVQPAQVQEAIALAAELHRIRQQRPLTDEEKQQAMAAARILEAAQTGVP